MIVIDTVAYDVPIIGMRRKASPLFKFAERTLDGELHDELIGWYYNYSDVRIGSITDMTTYHALYAKLTEPVTSHSVVVYDEEGTYTFNAYFANVEDALRKIKNGVYHWKDLTFDIIARSPARVPA